MPESCSRSRVPAIAILLVVSLAACDRGDKPTARTSSGNVIAQIAQNADSGNAHSVTPTEGGVAKVTPTDLKGVRYASYVVTPLRARDVAIPLMPGYALLAALSGDNDGVVPSWSQPWGELLGHLDADHWGAVGWSGRFDAPSFYANLVRELRLTA